MKKLQLWWYRSRIGASLRRWLRARTRRKAAKADQFPLREFVYLDEVSVFSLIASRLGPIATEFTDSESASLRGEIGGNAEASAGAGGNSLKGGVSARLERTINSGSQVLRKSIIQTTFRELYEHERNVLTISPIAADLSPPSITNIAQLPNSIDSLIDAGWATSGEELKRGSLIELEVELAAHESYRAGAVISVMVQMVEDNPDFLAMIAGDTFAQVAMLDRIVQGLLAGLVPIQGLVSDYKVVEIDRRLLLLHNKVAEQLSDTNGAQIYAPYVVGVAEETLFWKDVRRVLFADLRFNVLCRIARPGIQTNWTAVKLVDSSQSTDARSRRTTQHTWQRHAKRHE